MTKAMQWYFPSTNGGNSYGFQDSSAEHFRSDKWLHVMREVIQNSLDVRSSKNRPVKIKIREIEISRHLIGAEDLSMHMKATLERARDEKNPKAEAFYDHTLELLSEPNIRALAVIDSNTKGLAGDNWRSLIHEEGTSSKKDTSAAGGSYGIGKNAPYNVSALKTLCYSTRYIEDGKIRERFLCRSKMVTHKSPHNDEDLQNIGLGSYPDQKKNVRPRPIEKDSIPKAFRLDEPGTGIFIMGFEPKPKNWKNIAKKSISWNFFKAIHEKTLEVDLLGETISRDTLGAIFDKYPPRDRLQYTYYRIICGPKEGEIIKGKFGKFNVRVMADDHIKGSSGICYVNRKGMLITDEKSFKKNPFYVKSLIAGPDKFAAVIVAADDKTDEEIRKMEPPRHDTIEYRHIDDDDEREEKRRQLEEIRDMVKDVISKALGISSGQGDVLTELADVLPLEDDVHGKKSVDYGMWDADRTLETRILKSRPPSRRRSPSGEKDGPGEDGIGGGPGPGPGGPGPGGPGPGPGGPGPGGSSNRSAPSGRIYKKRITRISGGLRIAFTPNLDKEKEVMFGVMPAGEDRSKEKLINITRAKVISPHGTITSRSPRTITVAPGSAERIIVDLDVPGDQPYTGYEIEEFNIKSGGRDKK